MRRIALGLAITLLVSVMVGWPAIANAASTTLYLQGNGEPTASMSESVPPSQSLPDYDGKDGPGRTIQKNNSGSCESDPVKYQQWKYQTSGLTVTAGQLTIWAMPKDGDEDKTVRFVAYLIDSAIGCGTPLASKSTVLSDVEDWKKLTLSFNFSQHDFSSGSEIIVKIRVLDDSDDDMEFAYGTQQYNANLHLTTTTQPTTTTTTQPTTTTTQPTTTTTQPTTTTTTQPTTTTTQPTTTTTTQPTTTTTNAEADRETLTIGDSNTGRTKPEVVLLSNEGITESTDAFFETSGRKLKPQEGLMVTFSTAAETIKLYWRVAVALGAVMALLLMIGFRRIAGDETGPTQSNRSFRLRLSKLG